ncbi:hypothetical protein GGF38_002156, partial [Coemansia sp. RSA 25]
RDDHELALRSGCALMEILNVRDTKLAKRYRRKAASCGLLEVVYDILESLSKEKVVPDSSLPTEDLQDSALLGVCCNITKVYALRSAFHKQMVDLGYLPVLLCLAKNSIASLEFMRVGMESIVRLCTYLSAYRSADSNYAINPRMTQLLDLGAVDVIAACIRQDDQGVSSWGIGLLHEFVSRGVGKQQLAASPRIVQWLCRKLSTAKYAYTNQLILRSLWCLSTTTKAALMDTSHPPNLRRILNMFASENDTEAHYWSIALVSRIAVYPSSHLWILNSPLPRGLRGLMSGLPPNLRVTLFPEIANIISRMCHSIPLAPVLCQHPEIAETCRLLLSTDIETAQLATIMAIINATASSREFLKGVVDDDQGVRNEDEEASAAPVFTGDMRNSRLRCTLPILRIALATLADSLEPGLVVQSPSVTRRVLWLVRILHHEFPTLRAITMRLLSVINTQSLNKSDAAGLAHMCCSFLTDTSIGARGLVVDTEQQTARKSMLDLVGIVGRVPSTGSSRTIAEGDRAKPEDGGGHESTPLAASSSDLDWREWQSNLANIGISPEGARQPSEYYELYPELVPGTVALAGWFHARFALDRHVFGWKTCIEHYSCVAPPLVAVQDSDWWMIDRSGPRGPVHQRAGVELSSTVVSVPSDEGLAVLGSDAAPPHQLTERAVARFSADALPLISSPLSQFGHHSHSSASSATSISSAGSRSSRRRPTRPLSPFPATIFSDPSVDADGSASSAVSRPPYSLLVSPPKVLYYNQAPYFPAFVTLADGFSVWNSSWKFESVRMRTGIDGRLGGVHRFQVQLLTSGLLQVGWCTDQCNFYPESGEGVGDDF